MEAVIKHLKQKVADIFSKDQPNKIIEIDLEPQKNVGGNENNNLLQQGNPITEKVQEGKTNIEEVCRNLKEAIKNQHFSFDQDIITCVNEEQSALPQHSEQQPIQQKIVIQTPQTTPEQTAMNKTQNKNIEPSFPDINFNCFIDSILKQTSNKQLSTPSQFKPSPSAQQEKQVRKPNHQQAPRKRQQVNLNRVAPRIYNYQQTQPQPTKTGKQLSFNGTNEMIDLRSMTTDRKNGNIFPTIVPRNNIYNNDNLVLFNAELIPNNYNTPVYPNPYFFPPSKPAQPTNVMAHSQNIYNSFKKDTTAKTAKKNTDIIEILSSSSSSSSSSSLSEEETPSSNKSNQQSNSTGSKTNLNKSKPQTEQQKEKQQPPKGKMKKIGSSVPPSQNRNKQQNKAVREIKQKLQAQPVLPQDTTSKNNIHSKWSQMDPTVEEYTQTINANFTPLQEDSKNNQLSSEPESSSLTPTEPKSIKKPTYSKSPIDKLLQLDTLQQLKFSVNVKLLNQRIMDLPEIKKAEANKVYLPHTGPENASNNTIKALKPILKQPTPSPQSKPTTSTTSTPFRPSKPAPKQDDCLYQQFIKRRIVSDSQPIDLAVLSIDEVVEQCYNRKIITQQLYTEFVTFSTKETTLEFLNLFTDNRINEWNFKKLKITLMDHRRLSEWLLQLFPTHYTIGEPLALDSEILLFLKSMYDLPAQDYKHMLTIIDKLSKTQLWRNLQIKFGKMKANLQLSGKTGPNKNKQQQSLQPQKPSSNLKRQYSQMMKIQNVDYDPDLSPYLIRSVPHKKIIH